MPSRYRSQSGFCYALFILWTAITVLLVTALASVVLSGRLWVQKDVVRTQYEYACEGAISAMLNKIAANGQLPLTMTTGSSNEKNDETTIDSDILLDYPEAAKLELKANAKRESDGTIIIRTTASSDPPKRFQPGIRIKSTWEETKGGTFKLLSWKETPLIPQTP